MKNFEREVAKLAYDSILDDIPKTKNQWQQSIGVDHEQMRLLRQLSIIRSNDVSYRVTVTALIREAIKDLFIKYNIS